MSIRNELASYLQKVLTDFDLGETPIKLDYPTDPKHGDFSTNIALILAKKLGRNPHELATEISEKCKAKSAGSIVEKVEVAGPGFINFWLSKSALLKFTSTFDTPLKLTTPFTDKKIMVEFAHPNTHKAFHIGHLRNITTGETIVRLLKAAGAEVISVNYQGDVGMHIAKCLYGILHNPEFAIEKAGTDVKERVAFLGKAYAAGSKAYEGDESAKKEIGEINKKIYAMDASIADLYKTTRQWSLDYFEHIYKRVHTKFDRLYFESETFKTGKEIVLEGLKKKLFEESDGAIIFPGEKYGLHSRVFITSEGNPTYEGKEIGLAPLQFKEYHPDKIIHVVGPEQAGYFQVVFEALAHLFPEMRGKEYHLAYGWVKLKHGKMSSRTGNVVLGEWLLDTAESRIKESYESVPVGIAEEIAVAAVKYSFLKVGLSQEIAFDIDESIALDGNSGPYLQYAYARTQSVLRKSEPTAFDFAQTKIDLQSEERTLLKLLSRFADTVAEAAERYAPNLLCNYLFELAQTFNLFYQKCPILKSEGETKEFRLSLTGATGSALKEGLGLLGIQAPEKM